MKTKKISPQFFDIEEITTEISGNSPWEITDTHNVWAIESGQIQLFVFDKEIGIEKSRREYLLTVEPGNLILGMKRTNQNKGRAGVLAISTKSTIVKSITLEKFEHLLKKSHPTYLHHALNQWIDGMEVALKLPAIPKNSYGLSSQKENFNLEPSSCCHSLKELTWIETITGELSYLNNFSFHKTQKISPYPIGRNGWIMSHSKAEVKLKSTQEIASDSLLVNGLELYHQHTLVMLDHSIEKRLAHETKQIIHKAEFDSKINNLALNELVNVLDDSSIDSVEKTSLDPYLAVWKAIGENQGIAITHASTKIYENLNGRSLVQALAKNSKVRSRTITLSGKWWNEEAGNFFAFLKDSNDPVALLQKNGGGYELFNPKNYIKIKITPEVAKQINPIAIIFYRPFNNQPITTKTLLHFASQDLKPELIRVLICAIAVGILSLLAPIITENLFGNAIPYGKKFLIYQLTAFLIGSAVANALIGIGQNIAILRIEGKAGTNLQAALWDRLLNLPATFFRKYSSGELANHAMGFDKLRELIMGSVITAVISFASSLFSFALLFKYDTRLAFLGSFLAFITIGIVITNAYTQLKFQHQVNEIGGKLMGFVFQLLSGIGKLRIAGAEGRALNKWAQQFSQQKKLTVKALMWNALLTTFRSTWSTISTTIILWYITFVIGKSDFISPAQLLGFNAAFGQFIGAMLGVASVISSIVQAGPIYNKIQPILNAKPEVTENKKDPGTLVGRIEISHVNFRYAQDLPLILDNLSIQIEPGEFIALVGPSGTGKSSIFRLLLGFDLPESGTIYFDGQDLETLDIQTIRKQIGVVIQNAKLFPGDILTNIIGSQPYTIEDAWTAAEMVGLDQDLKNMPMGMHTYISEGGGSLSGGQTQRLMIARALIGRPKILLFDEATSALDNKTQAIVTQSIEQLHATRIVIAHRLTTIEKADKIIVLNNKKIVQQGTYTQLIGQPGVFQELAKRQLA